MNVNVIIDGKPVLLENVIRKGQEVSFTFSRKNYSFQSHRLPNGDFLLEHESSSSMWRRDIGNITLAGKDFRHIQLKGREAKISEQIVAAAQASAQSDLCPAAPMSGIVHKILVKLGDRVKKGQGFAVMEAMKVQTTLAAGGDAIVDQILVREGEVIAEGSVLVRLSPAKGAA